MGNKVEHGSRVGKTLVRVPSSALAERTTREMLNL